MVPTIKSDIRSQLSKFLSKSKLCAAKKIAENCIMTAVCSFRFLLFALYAQIAA